MFIGLGSAFLTGDLIHGVVGNYIGNREMLFEYLRKFLSRHKVCRHVLGRTAVVHIYPLTAHSVRHCKYPAGGKGIRKPGYKPLGIREMLKRINKPIGPYFRQRNLTLRELEARHLQMFYSEMLRKVTPNTVIHYHAIIHSALKYAVKTDMLVQNVADKVDRPKKNSFQPVFLSAEEMQRMFEALRGTKLELPVLVAAFYGFRRGEVLGLKWDAIDFERGTISVIRTVTTITVDGKQTEIEQQSAKTKSSLRTLPLIGSFREYFLQVKEAQELNKQVCGNCYNHEYDGFVFVDELGERMRANYLTSAFPKFLESHGLRRMRFHDLRHSCAPLLLANGVPLKQIQEWLGHSDIGTTANIYSHLDYKSKITSANVMDNILTLPDTRQTGWHT